ncbi:MAG: AAA family ATPase [Lachnospiraceae bacterium]|nr:AAA family ATPase [Lachnospiraceae bacterium]
MYIRKLELKHFGKYLAQTLDLHKGINVIYGPNEAGKTTIKDYILGIWYGMKMKRDRPGRLSEYTRYRPFDQEQYDGSMTIVQGDRVYEVERYFDKEAPDTITVWEMNDEKDKKALEFLPGGELPVDITGMEKKLFLNTLCFAGDGAVYSSHLWEYERDAWKTDSDGSSSEKASSAGASSDTGSRSADTPGRKKGLAGLYDLLRLTPEQKRQMDPQLKQILSVIKVLFVFGLFALMILIIYILPISAHYKLWLIVIAMAVIIYIWVRSILRSLPISFGKKKSKGKGNGQKTDGDTDTFDDAHVREELSEQASAIAKCLTAGAYTDVKLDDHLRLAVNKDGSYVDPGYLSLGARQQIYLAVRLAVAKNLVKEGMVSSVSQLPPILLDDVFGAYDDERMKAAIQYLAEYDCEQIILLTHEKRIRELMKELDIDHHFIEL